MLIQPVRFYGSALLLNGQFYIMETLNIPVEEAGYVFTSSRPNKEIEKDRETAQSGGRNRPRESRGKERM